MPIVTRTIPTIIVENIDGKVPGSTPLPMVPNDFVIMAMFIKTKAISSVITPPSISLGTNSTSYNNKVPLTLVPSALSVVNRILPILSVTLMTDVFIPAGAAPQINIGLGAVAGTYIFDLILIGDFIN